MRIGNYEIKQDEYCYHLLEWVVTKEGQNAGEEYTRVVGYFGNLKHLVSNLIDKEILSSDKEDIINKIDDSVAKLSKMLCDVLQRM